MCQSNSLKVKIEIKNTLLCDNQRNFHMQKRFQKKTIIFHIIREVYYYIKIVNTNLKIQNIRLPQKIVLPMRFFLRAVGGS